MAEITSGLDALEALVNGGEDSVENKFTSFKSGDTRKVKVIALGDVKEALTYSIFKVVNTFSPETPPKLSRKGFPVENLTPFDLAWQYHQDQSTEFGDKASQEAGKYRIKQRFAFGFYDLDEKEMIVIDFSKKQATTLYGVLKKQADKLDKRAFELEKSGTGTNTTVSLTPEPLDDLTDAQQKAFEEAPEEFDKSLFENLYYVMDEEQQLEALTKAGFDVTLIGFEKPSADESEPAQTAEVNEEDPTENF